MTKKTEPQFRTAYGDPVKTPFYTKGDSLTQQHFKDECEIENVIRKHDSTGLISHITRGKAQYGDYSEVNEYREALDLINNADESFNGLPSEIRKIFGNNAGDFFEFATNPDNAEKMVELGLAPSPTGAPQESGKEAEASKKAAPESEATAIAED